MYCCGMFISNYKRKISSLNQRILLLTTDLIYGKFVCDDGDNNSDNDDESSEIITGIKCRILGTSDRIYIVNVKKTYDKIECTCNCPDYLMRKVNCKHIYWLGRNKFGSFDPDTWQVEYYNDFVVDAWLYDYNDDLIGRNENCPICLEEIDHQVERTICCKNNCGNSVHSVCWTRYYEATHKTKCVLCREDTMPYIL